jgi:hypothetical protein
MHATGIVMGSSDAEAQAEAIASTAASQTAAGVVTMTPRTAIAMGASGALTARSSADAVAAGGASGTSTPRTRQSLLSRIRGMGNSAATSLTGALRALKERGMQIDEADLDAAEAGAVVSDNLRLAAPVRYRPPRADALPHTFIEDHIAGLRARLAALESQRHALLRQSQPAVVPPLRSVSRSGLHVAGQGGADGARQAPSLGRPAEPNEHLHRVLVESLYPPCILSALAVTEPWHGLEPGDWVAETYVELLVIAKTQIDHRVFSKAQLSQVQASSTKFPKDVAIIEESGKDRRWEEYRRKAMAEVDKRKWPLAQHNARLKDIGSGKQIVVPMR